MALKQEFWLFEPAVSVCFLRASKRESCADVCTALFCRFPNHRHHRLFPAHHPLCPAHRLCPAQHLRFPAQSPWCPAPHQWLSPAHHLCCPAHHLCCPARHPSSPARHLLCPARHRLCPAHHRACRRAVSQLGSAPKAQRSTAATRPMHHPAMQPAAW
jgi:hypothetical protein